MKKLDRILVSEEFNKCLNCNHVSYEYGEIDVDDDDEADVVCPKCLSLDYYIMGQIKPINEVSPSHI